MASIAVAGATGLVGEKVVRVLEARSFPVKELRLLASEHSEGKEMEFRGQKLVVTKLEDSSFEGMDVAFFALDESLTHKYVPKAMKHCLVIDKSSAYRLKEDVPLVVPEVNPDRIAGHKNLIAVPNCTTIPLVVVLAPLHHAFGLSRVVVASYQSASGAGRDALEEYRYETEFLALGQPVERPDDSPFPTQLAGNVIPQIGKFHSDGYTVEEHKLIAETRKIMELPDLAISATCVRVPVAVGHALAVVAEFREPVTPEKAHKLLGKSEGIVVLDGNRYPTPIDVVESDEVFVGRIRRDFSSDEGLHFWIVTDNLRKGAATNAVQIAELALLKKR